MWNDSVKKEAGKYLAGAGVIVCMLAAQAYVQKTPVVNFDVAGQMANIQPAAGDEKPAAVTGQFGERKKALLKSIGDTIERMQKRQACISAAADEKALDACRGKKDAPAAVK